MFYPWSFNSPPRPFTTCLGPFRSYSPISIQHEGSEREGWELKVDKGPWQLGSLSLRLAVRNTEEPS